MEDFIVSRWPFLIVAAVNLNTIRRKRNWRISIDLSLTLAPTAFHDDAWIIVFQEDLSLSGYFKRRSESSKVGVIFSVVDIQWLRRQH